MPPPVPLRFKDTSEEARKEKGVEYEEDAASRSRPHLTMRRRTPWPQAMGPRTFDWARIQSRIATAASALSSPAPTSTSQLPDERSNPRGHFAQEKELAQQMKADQKQECQEQKQRQWPGRRTRAGASWRRWPWRANPLSPSRPRLPWGIAKTMPDPSRCSTASKGKGKVLPPSGSRHWPRRSRPPRWRSCRLQ